MMDGDNLPATLDGVEAALAEIPVGTPGYFRNEAQPARYLALLRRKEGLAAEREPAAASEPGLTAWASREEFAAACPGVDYRVYVEIERALGDVWVSVPEDERDDFIRSFHALPAAVSAAMAVELQDRSYAGSSSHSEEDFECFVANGGREIVREWGHDARRLLAHADARLDRIAGNLDSEANVQALTNWICALSPAAVTAVFRKLAA